MLVNKEDIEKLAKQIRYDMSVTKTRLDQLMQMVASLPMPANANAIVCTRGCGPLSTLTNERQLAHHLKYVHDEDPGGDPVEVHPPDSRAESQAGLNGPSGSPTSPPGPAA